MKPFAKDHSLRCVLYAVFLLGVLSAPLSAAAQQPQPTTSQAQYRKAYKAMEQGQWSDAKSLLLDLWSKAQTYDVAESLSHVEFHARNYAASARYMSFAIDNTPPQDSPRNLEARRSKLAEAKAHVGTVHVSVAQPAVDVIVDGESVGVSPLRSPVFLDPGRHMIGARSANGDLEPKPLEVVAGATYQVELDVPLSSSTAPAVTTSPPPTTVPPPPSQMERDRYTWVPVYVTGGLALVALGVGTGFALDAKSAKSSGETKLAEAKRQFGDVEPCGVGGSSATCSELNSLQDRRSRSKTIATVSFVMGGVFAAAAVGSYVLWAPKGAASSRMSAWVGGQGGGLQFQGSFQ
jgi:hypothetical protein